MKRALQAGMIVCALVAAAALWAQQTPSGPGVAPATIEQRVEAYLRHYYAWGPQISVQASAPKPSLIPGLYEVPVTISYKTQKNNATVYVSPDGKYMIRGLLSNLLVDPFAAARTKLAGLTGQPHLGPAKACVNVAEFADFECPHCREANLALKQLEPKYPGIRFTFLDFPLTQIHPWSLKAALAARCAYKQNPADYVPYRDAIFAAQNQITAANVSTKLLSIASKVGLNSSTLTACMAEPATHQEVTNEENLGKSLHVNSTPTFFVNGRPMVGGTEQMLVQFIQYEKEQCQPHQASK